MQEREESETDSPGLQGNEQDSTVKSVYKGVYKCGRKFKAQIQIDRVQHYLGLFDNEIEAAIAYDTHARIILGKRARTNFMYGGNLPPSIPNPTPCEVTSSSSSDSLGMNDSMPAIPLTLTGKVPTQRKKRLYSGMQAKRQGGGLDNATDSALTGAIASALTNLSYERPIGTLVGRNRPLSREYKVVGGEEGRSSPTFSHAESDGGEPAAKVSRAPSVPQIPIMDTGKGKEVAVKDPLHVQQLQQLQQMQQQMQSGRAPTQAQLMQMHMHMASLQQAHPGYLAHHQQGMPIYPHPYPGHFMPGNMMQAHVPPGHQQQFGAAGYPPFMQMYGMPPQGAFHPGGFMLPNGQFMPHSMAFPPAASESRGALVTAEPATTVAPVAAPIAGPIAAPIAGPVAGTATAAKVQEQASAPAGGGAAAGSNGGGADGAGGANSHIAAVQAHAQAQAQAQRTFPVRTPNTSNPATCSAGASSIVSAASGLIPIPSGQLPAQYWAGVLYYDALRCVQVWKGSWVNLTAAQAGQKPSPELLARSASQFEYVSEVVQRSLAVAADGSLQPQSGFLRGTYRMISELTGKFETFTDREFFIEYEHMAELGDTKRYAVYGSGDCQFGAFVVTGTFNALSSVMELTRQYISV